MWSLRGSLHIAILLLGSCLCAQQAPQYSQYLFNGTAINPAYTGQRELFTAQLLHRSQWVSMPGAPTTTTWVMHSPLSSPVNNVGFQIQSDKLGVSKVTQVNALYSYAIPMATARLRFGLQAGLVNIKHSWDFIETTIPVDGAFGSDAESFWAPSFGAGVLVVTKKLMLSLGVPQLTEHDFSQNSLMGGKYKRHVFLHAAYAAEIAENWIFKPSVLLKYLSAQSAQFDFNGELIWAERLFLGASYRMGAEVVLMGQMRLKRRLFLGYSYDINISGLDAYQTGTHELIITYEHKDASTKIFSPRYF